MGDFETGGQQRIATSALMTIFAMSAMTLVIIGSLLRVAYMGQKVSAELQGVNSSFHLDQEEFLVDVFLAAPCLVTIAVAWLSRFQPGVSDGILFGSLLANGPLVLLVGALGAGGSGDGQAGLGFGLVLIPTWLWQIVATATVIVRASRNRDCPSGMRLSGRGDNSRDPDT